MEGKISEIQTKSDTVESHLKKEREKAKRSNERYKTLQKNLRETSKEQRAKVEELEKNLDESVNNKVDLSAELKKYRK